MSKSDQTAFRRAEKAFQVKDERVRPPARRTLLPRDRCPPVVDALAGGVGVRELAAAASADGSVVRRFAFADHEGLLLLSGALSVVDQLRLARAALLEWSEPPNLSNLSATHDVAALTRLFERAELDAEHAAAALLPLRRWVTLGYQYDWTNRTYDEAAFVGMPRQLHALVSALVRLAYDAETRFASEAVIVNYYHAESSLCGHLDDAERFFDAPIVSLSLGLDCVFLVGGPTRDVPPTPLLLRSGDVLIMGGASRRAYHGVPRIFAASFAPHAEQTAIIAELLGARDDDARERQLLTRVWAWLSQMRININVRQVNRYDDRREPQLDH